MAQCIDTRGKSRRPRRAPGEIIPSKITIPEKAIPHVKLVYQLMRENNVTYDELEFRSGILKSTFKAWRVATAYPSLFALEAALGVFGWSLVPVPPLSTLKPETLEKLEDVGMDFRTDNETMGAAIDRHFRELATLALENGNTVVPLRVKPVGGRALVWLKTRLGGLAAVTVFRGSKTLAEATGLAPSQIANLHLNDLVAILEAAGAITPFDARRAAA